MVVFTIPIVYNIYWVICSQEYHPSVKFVFGLFLNDGAELSNVMKQSQVYSGFSYKSGDHTPFSFERD